MVFRASFTPFNTDCSLVRFAFKLPWGLCSCLSSSFALLDQSVDTFRVVIGWSLRSFLALLGIRGIDIRPMGSGGGAHRTAREQHLAAPAGGSGTKISHGICFHPVGIFLQQRKILISKYGYPSLRAISLDLSDFHAVIEDVHPLW